MILDIEHVLAYSYSDLVGLNPHYLYLSPKPNPYQKVISQSLDVHPEPNVMVKNIDQENNIQHVCFFNSTTNSLIVSSKIRIETEVFSPLNFVFYPFETSKIPFHYKGKLGINADFFLKNKHLSEEIICYAEEIAKAANYVTLNFLMEIVTRINQEFSYLSREMGEANTSLYTFNSKFGTCRDFCVLMMDLCAAKGLVARFVSGYLFGSELHEHELHAWVEVLLPGGGWRGFDPTEGRVVNQNYIALAASVESIGLNPVRGTFRGPKNVVSELKTKVKIIEIAS